MKKWLDDDHKVILRLGKNLNPSPLVGVGTKRIGNLVQCSSGRAENTLPLCSPEYCRIMVNNKILETVAIVKI